MPVRTLPIALLGALAVAAPAHAESVVYLDDHNVVAASPDGAVKRVLTTDGTEDSSYRSPSADDSGRWLAARSGTWYWRAADGKLLSADLVDKGKCDSLNTGPTAGRLDPSGDFVAFESMCSGFGGQDITPRVVINFPGRPTLGNAPVLEGYRQPTWMGSRLVVDGGNGVFVQDDTAEAPVSTAFTGWLPYSVGRAEVSRDRRRALLAVDADGPGDGTDELWLARVDADPPVGQPTAACKIPIQGAATRAGFSPAGDRVVWRDDRGVVVARAYEPPPSGTEQVGPCEPAGIPVVLSATGQEPSFTAADLHAGRATPPPGGTPTPEPTGTPTPAPGGGTPLSVALPERARIKALKRGLALAVTAPAAGNGRAVLKVSRRAARRLRSRRTVVTAAFTAPAAGPLTVRLKAPKRVANRLRRLRRLPVHVAASLGGETVSLRRTLRR